MAAQVSAAMSGGSGPGNMPTQADAAAAAEKKAQQEEMREDLLTRLLAADAKERIATNLTPPPPPLLAVVLIDEPINQLGADRASLARQAREGAQARGHGHPDGMGWTHAGAPLRCAAQEPVGEGLAGSAFFARPLAPHFAICHTPSLPISQPDFFFEHLC